MSRGKFFTSVAVSAAVAGVASADTFVSNPFRGVTHYERFETSPRQVAIHVLEFDLTDPGLRFYTTPSNGALPGEVTGATTRAFMTSIGAQMAINTGFFASAGTGTNSQGQQEIYRNLSHIAVSDGAAVSPWSGSGSTREAALNITQANVASIIRPANVNVADYNTNPAGVSLWTTVGGNERMIAGGTIVATDTVLHPRTCIGVKGSRLYMFLVDGRQPGWSDGMNLVEIANLLKNDYGVTDAVNVDGGGSSTMAVANPAPHVLNRPSDGTERTVGNSLAVYAVPSQQWYVNASGSWTAAGNWALGAVPNAVGAVANFGEAILASRTVTVNADVTVGAVNFHNANSYSLSGASRINLDVASGPASINVSRPSSQMIAAPVALADDLGINVITGAALTISAGMQNTAGKAVTKTGSGALVVGGASNHGLGATFNASAGTTTFNSDAGSGSATLAISVASGATVNFAASQVLGFLSVASGGTARITALSGQRVVSARSVSIGSGGRIDVGDDRMIIDYATASPIATIVAQLTAGYNGGAWNGNGITSSSVSPGFALGVAEASDAFTTFPATFVGVNVDNTAILIRHTTIGDANLDGISDTLDFNALAGNFSQTGRRWSHGDFNYNGTVDSTDFNLLTSRFGSVAPASDFGATVPEPATLGALFASAAMMSLRARRKKF